MTKIKPLGDKVLIQFLEEKEGKKSFLVIPDEHKREKIAKILEVGDDSTIKVKKGDKVLINAHAMKAEVEEGIYLIGNFEILAKYV